MSTLNLALPRSHAALRFTEAAHVCVAGAAATRYLALAAHAASWLCAVVAFGLLAVASSSSLATAAAPSLLLLSRGTAVGEEPSASSHQVRRKERQSGLDSLAPCNEAELALDTGTLTTAEQEFNECLSRNVHMQLDDPRAAAQFQLELARVYLQDGKSAQAVKVLVDLIVSFENKPAAAVQVASAHSELLACKLNGVLKADPSPDLKAAGQLWPRLLNSGDTAAATAVTYLSLPQIIPDAYTRVFDPIFATAGNILDRNGSRDCALEVKLKQALLLLHSDPERADRLLSAITESGLDSPGVPRLAGVHVGGRFHVIGPTMNTRGLLTLIREGPTEFAATCFESAYQAEASEQKPIDSDLVKYLSNEAYVLIRLRRLQDAKQVLLKAADICDKSFKEDDPTRASVFVRVAQLGLAQNDVVSAAEALSRAAAIAEDPRIVSRFLISTVLPVLAEYYLAIGLPYLAQASCERLIQTLDDGGAPESELSLAWEELGEAYLHEGRVALARESFDKAISAIQGDTPASAGMRAHTYNTVARAEYDCHQFSSALKDFDSELAIYAKWPELGWPKALPRAHLWKSVTYHAEKDDVQAEKELESTARLLTERLKADVAHQADLFDVLCKEIVPWEQEFLESSSKEGSGQSRPDPELLPCGNATSFKGLPESPALTDNLLAPRRGASR